MSLHIVQRGVATRSLARSPRLLLQTDATSAQEIPSCLHAVADSLTLGDLRAWQTAQVPANCDAVVAWLSGERLLCGSPALIRQDLRAPGRRCFVPLHLPCLPEMPLLTLEPRWFSASPTQEAWNYSLRICSSARLSIPARAALEARREPWAELRLALDTEQSSPGAGVPVLERLWAARERLPAVLTALALRDLFLLHIRSGDAARAEQLLTLGSQTFPGYADLNYLAALWHLREGRAARALPYLEKTRAADRAFLGSGGESTYRADWLRGILALRVGNEGVAFEHLRHGLLCQPPFAPAAEELLSRVWPPRLVATRQSEFCNAALREPRLEPRVFEFLVGHRCFGAARELLEAARLSADQKEAQHHRLSAAAAPYGPQRTGATARPGLLVQGPLFDYTSLARVNRALATTALANSGWDTRLEPSSPASLLPELFPQGPLLRGALLAPLERLDLTVCHQWPPDFRRPSQGRLAVILPWEYGAVPRPWVRSIEENVDELWVPSEFVRQVLRRAGASRTAIEVLPNGFDPAIFTPQGPASRPLGCRRCAFLFVGGAIRRKGVDLLLEAYRAAFHPTDDVTLVLLLSDAAGSYRHNSLSRNLRQSATDIHTPHVQILSEPLNDATLASLYRGCDALAMPYRGEGFGLPLLEARACGKPVITTAAGPAPEFCDESSAYLIPAQEQQVPDDPPPLGPLAGEFTWFEPDFGSLVAALRRIYEYPEEAAQRGRLASHQVHQNYTWKHLAQKFWARVEALTPADFR